MSDDARSEAADDERFTETLRAAVADDWVAATEHRFTDELASDDLDDDVFAAYLVQDYAFVGDLTAAFGAAVADAPTTDARRPYVEFLDTLTAEENDFFERAFETLDVPRSARADPDLAAPTAAFRDLLGRARREGGYAETLAVLLPAEWAYLSWATRVADAEPATDHYREWIELHVIPEFEAFVEFMRDELDAIGPELSPRRRERVAELFARTVELEVAFFDAAYELAGDRSAGGTDAAASGGER